MKKSPSLALKIGTSLGFCLVFAPCFWRFGWGFQEVLFLVLSIAGVWGFFYKRDWEKSRVEQDWELFFWSFFMLACGVSILAITRFSLVDRNFLPTKWIVPALVICVPTSIAVFRYDLRDSKGGAKFFVYIFGPIMMFMLAVGILGYINGALDFRAPRMYAVSIQSKRLDRGKSGRGPLLRVPFWQDKTRSVEVRVSYDDWCRARIGDTARVNIKPGFLGAEWVEAVRVD